MMNNIIILKTTTILLLVVLASYNVTDVQAQLNSTLMDQEVQKLKGIDNLKQKDIDQAFLTIKNDCIIGDEGNLAGCHVAVFIALSIALERELGLEIEEGDPIDERVPPKMVE